MLLPPAEDEATTKIVFFKFGTKHVSPLVTQFINIWDTKELKSWLESAGVQEKRSLLILRYLGFEELQQRQFSQLVEKHFS